MWAHEAVLTHARSEPQREVCGLLAAVGERIAAHYRIPNVAAEPRGRFDMEPGALIGALREMREHGQTLWAIYHSHPEGPPRPSPRDLAEAAYPEALYLIVVLRPHPAVRAWRLQRDAFAEVELDIGD